MVVANAAAACTFAVGPLAAYERHCNQSTIDACKEFVDGLAELADPSAEERLALLRGLRRIERDDEDGHSADAERAHCERRAALMRDHPEYAEAWYEYSFCVHEHAETVALLETALALEPTNMRALGFLTLLADDSWREYGFPAAKLIAHQRTGYETADDEATALLFASQMYRTSLESGQPELAKAVQDRLRRDLGLATRDYTGRRGTESIELVCSFPVLYTLTEACVAGMETVFARAAGDGAPPPDDVISVIPDVLKYLDYVPPGASPPFVLDGPPRLPVTESAKSRYAVRLRQAMEQVGQRSTEFTRVYAMFRDGPW